MEELIQEEIEDESDLGVKHGEEMNMFGAAREEILARRAANKFKRLLARSKQRNARRKSSEMYVQEQAVLLFRDLCICVCVYGVGGAILIVQDAPVTPYISYSRLIYHDNTAHTIVCLL